jgi:hypothetical protein
MITFAKHLAFLRIVSVGLAVLGGTLPAVRAQTSDQKLPLLTAAALPLYPIIAQAARVQGIVKLRVTTDGKRVKSIDLVSGPPMLFEAAKRNIQTWEFEEHKPTSFVTTFEYRIEEPAQCFYSNGNAVLHLPLEARLGANGLETCDPSTEIQTIVPSRSGSKQ